MKWALINAKKHRRVWNSMRNKRWSTHHTDFVSKPPSFSPHLLLPSLSLPLPSPSFLLASFSPSLCHFLPVPFPLFKSSQFWGVLYKRHQPLPLERGVVSLTPNQFSIAFPSTQRRSNYNTLSGFCSILCFIYLPILRIGMLKIIKNGIILYRYSTACLHLSTLYFWDLFMMCAWMHAKSLQSCPTLCNPMDCSPPGSSVHGDSPGKNTGLGCHAFLQELFLTQGLNPCLLCLLHCKWIIYPLSHLGSPCLWWFRLTGGASGKESTCQCRRYKRLGFDPWLGRSPGGEHGNPLQYSCLENPMDRGAWQATVPWVTKSQTWLKWLSKSRLSPIIGLLSSSLCYG